MKKQHWKYLGLITVGVFIGTLCAIAVVGIAAKKKYDEGKQDSFLGKLGIL